MLKTLLRRYRRFMQAEIMAELRAQNELAKQMEAALLTLALLQPEKASTSFCEQKEAKKLF